MKKGITIILALVTLSACSDNEKSDEGVTTDQNDETQVTLLSSEEVSTDNKLFNEKDLPDGIRSMIEKEMTGIVDLKTSQMIDNNNIEDANYKGMSFSFSSDESDDLYMGFAIMSEQDSSWRIEEVGYNKVFNDHEISTMTAMGGLETDKQFSVLVGYAPDENTAYAQAVYNRRIDSEAIVSESSKAFLFFVTGPELIGFTDLKAFADNDSLVFEK
ncbi:hypothetical protein [Jeotgalibacillus salarius]|uniref:Uncharacterized protein n=1 Tax=Jeotgalibacillus salarius TaxID=546023 RepID=A0A4Y8LAM5_9BACL|nr:hypothetical protein [Jeotgalibacillus salarius]TFD99427.1 hypothetical protein E2626_14305 [Jeotgalibacillus salarius]